MPEASASIPSWIALLPALNATLNATQFAFLLFGYRFIRAGQRDPHRRCMLGALTCAAIFLVSYLTLHFYVGATRFGHEGTLVRMVYFAILLTHTALAMTLPVLVPITLWRALRERFDRHRAIARWTLPIWLYVSVTGVFVYLMLYQIPGAEGLADR